MIAPIETTLPPLAVDYDQAGAMLSVSRSSINRMVKAGLLKVVRPTPQTARIVVRSIEVWIAKQQEGASNG